VGGLRVGCVTSSSLVGRVVQQVGANEPVLLIDSRIILSVATPWYLRVVVIVGPLSLSLIVSLHIRN
jgi:hypothetical protein